MTDFGITAFLPCRKGSQRVKNKNTRDFCRIKGGLTTIKLKQLVSSNMIDRIIISTDDEYIKKISAKQSESSSKQIIVIDRPKDLASSETSTDALIKHVPEIIERGHILWTHVTSPFVNGQLYDDAITAYLNALKKEYDSLMSITRFRKFIWDENGPINYKRNIEKWPKTQKLTSLFEINNAIFINSIENYIKFGDRIGENPYLFGIDGYRSFDIDWDEDFRLAEAIYKYEKNI